MSIMALETKRRLFTNDFMFCYIICDLLYNLCWLSLFSLMFYPVQSQNSEPGCQLRMKDYTFEYKYSQAGDIIIGGIFTVHSSAIPWRYAWEEFSSAYCIYSSFQEYRHLLAFIFAINDINNRTDILPNITLGYHLYDSCGHVNKVIKDVMQIMSGHSVTAPNYSCLDYSTLAGFIGDLRSTTTLPMAQLLGLYGYAQVSYGARDSLLSDRTVYPHFFRTVPDNEMQYAVLVKLLLYFKWNMVCIFTTDDEIGEREVRLLSKELTKSGICIEITISLKNTKVIDSSVMKDLKAEVIILCGTSTKVVQLILFHSEQTVRNKTFIFLPSWSHDSLNHEMNVNCSLIFIPPRHSVNGFEEWVLSFHPSTHPNDPILEDLWITSFYCLSRNNLKNVLLQYIVSVPFHNCTGEEHFTDQTHYYSDGIPYKVYTAVQMMAQALDDMHKTLQISTINKEANETYVYRRNLRRYMKLICIDGPETKSLCFNNKGEIPETLEILNFIKTITNHSSETQYTEGCATLVGTFDEALPPDQQLTISSLHINWINNKMPYSRCSERCYPGFRKAMKEGPHTCCYDCILCSEGEIANESDAENCQKCFYTEWPNETRDKCVPKIIEFLFYEKDVVAFVFLLLSVLSFVTILLIIGIFVYFRNTLVVRANNRTLSFIILISLKFSLLCVFLFIGKPEDTTCMFRHIGFGIIFTVVLSSILAKTTMVCVAFKATTPGSSWRKWIGVKVPNYIVLIFSSLQVLNGILWLSCSPPSQESDMDSYPGKIIIQCNEGSQLAFYFMMGYMGFLAAVSLVLAFLVRTLPDVYNEAKYITFSMLVFFSVWICAIPAYVSSKGKNTVTVEVFAVLASCNGIMFCIFLPKLWDILTKPELKTRRLLEK